MDRKRLKDVLDKIKKPHKLMDRHFALLCPFCFHKTPSLSIDIQKRIYECRAFNCKRAGITDDLLEEYDGK